MDAPLGGNYPQNGHLASANGRPIPSVEPQFREGRENQDVLYALKIFPEPLNEARRLAIINCRRSRNPEDEASLIARAEAISNSFILEGRYDPLNNPADNIREEKYQKNRKDLPSLEDQEQIEIALERDHERNGAPTTKPEVSLVVKAAAVVVFTFIVAQTLHDCVFFEFGDVVIAWLASAFVGIPLAVYITATTLDESSVDEKSGKLNKGLISGILVGVALCLLRLTTGLEGETIVFTLAFTMLEMAIVIGLWGKGLSFRREMALWCPYAANKARLENTRKEIKELAAVIDEHIKYVRGRNRLCDLYDQGKLTEILTKLLLSRYHDGIGENISWVKGIGEKPELKEANQWKLNGKSH